MRVLVLIPLILCSYISYGQIDFGYESNVLSKRVEQLVLSINRSKIIEERGIYYSGIKASIYPELRKLSSRATLEELKELIKHPNPVLRYYSYEILRSRKIEDEQLFFNLAKRHLIDTSSVATQNGCIVGSIGIGDHIYRTSKLRLSKESIATLDSLLFWGGRNQIASRDKLFNTVAKNEANYQRLREILAEEKNIEALIPILSYNRREDKELISKYSLIAPKYVIDALCIDPRKEYLDEILAIQNNISPEDLSNPSWIKLYKIGIALGQEISLQIFENGLSLPDSASVSKHARFIYGAIKDNTADYLNKIRLGTLPFLNSMTLDYFERIWSYDSLKTYAVLLDRFSNDNHPYWQKDLIHLMIDKIEGLLGEKSIDFINRGIANGYSITYYTLSLRARKYKDIESVKILVNRFNEEEKKDEGTIYYRTKGILNYDDNRVYEQIEEQAFNFLNNAKLSIYSDSLIALGMKCNRLRCIETLFGSLAENSRSEMFLQEALATLIALDDVAINQRLIDIYQSNRANYKKTRFGRHFYDRIKRE